MENVKRVPPHENHRITQHNRIRCTFCTAELQWDEGAI